MAWISLILALLCLILGGVVFTQRNTIEKLNELVATDPLTGLLNRRAFERAFIRLLKLLPDDGNKRHPPLDALSVFFVDLDHFKRINDTHGHAVGDEVLQKVAEVIRHTLRESDLVCRWGGEELVVALAGFSEPEATEVAEKVRKAIASTTFSVSGLRVTASLGVTATKRWVSQESLIEWADMAVYEAKKTGRDRVVTNYH